MLEVGAVETAVIDGDFSGSPGGQAVQNTADKTMIKTLAAANKSEREPFRIPRSVQQSIPIQRVGPEEVMEDPQALMVVQGLGPAVQLAEALGQVNVHPAYSTACPPGPPLKSPSITAVSTVRTSSIVSLCV